MKRLTAALSALMVFIIPSVLYADRGGWCLFDSGWFTENSLFGGHMPSGGLFMFLFPLITIILIIFAFIFFNNKKNIDFKRETPLDILKARFARGDITKKEFEIMKTELK